jgi:hypothetical protein
LTRPQFHSLPVNVQGDGTQRRAVESHALDGEGDGRIKNTRDQNLSNKLDQPSMASSVNSAKNFWPSLLLGLLTELHSLQLIY